MIDKGFNKNGNEKSVKIMMKQKNSSKGLLKAKLRESSAANSKISLVTGKFKTMAKYAAIIVI
ncbi:hypothetical protein MW374_004670 [Vibrio parahaemolyticus]|nr:hypothetical protein [Vibrio parahaemolyticus]EJE4159667.1 hypothetical protein [Vibrio parahaemolyticus]HBC3821730.1 hypothetical protein [Vibrio parahaemolyticus]